MFKNNDKFNEDWEAIKMNSIIIYDFMKDAYCDEMNIYEDFER